MRSFLILLLSCGAWASDPPLLKARKGFTTRIVHEMRESEPLPTPPEGLFELVRYPGPVGELTALLTPPHDGAPKPAMVWITGGFPAGGVGTYGWEQADPTNDQSARAYREAGMVMMYPTMRGTFGNPGAQEQFFGEVDDVLAAIAFLRGQAHVDAKQIYLGGHSTGGTLALLVAAARPPVKAVVALGPVDDPAGYGRKPVFDPTRSKEARLRAPIHFLDAVRVPTWVIEGADGNAGSLHAMDDVTSHPAVHFLEVPDTNHFEIIHPTNRLIAQRITSLGGGDALSLTVEELTTALAQTRTYLREAEDLAKLAGLRQGGVALTRTAVVYKAYTTDPAAASLASSTLTKRGWTHDTSEGQTEDGRPFFAIRVRAQLDLGDLTAVFARSAELEAWARSSGLYYDGWWPDESPPPGP